MLPIKKQNSYDYSGVNIKISDLPKETHDYAEYISTQLSNRRINDNTWESIKNTNEKIIKQQECGEVLTNHQHHTIEEVKTCVDAYKAIFNEAMYISASNGWETPNGCCKVVVSDW